MLLWKEIQKNAIKLLQSTMQRIFLNQQCRIYQRICRNRKSKTLCFSKSINWEFSFKKLNGNVMHSNVNVTNWEGSRLLLGWIGMLCSMSFHNQMSPNKSFSMPLVERKYFCSTSQLNQILLFWFLRPHGSHALICSSSMFFLLFLGQERD